AGPREDRVDAAQPPRVAAIPIPLPYSLWSELGVTCRCEFACAFGSRRRQTKVGSISRGCSVREIGNRWNRNRNLNSRPNDNGPVFSGPVRESRCLVALEPGGSGEPSGSSRCGGE